MAQPTARTTHTHTADEPARAYFGGLLRDRRVRLDALEGLDGLRDADEYRRLLREVDNALARLEDGSFGRCTTCHESIDRARLVVDPLIRVCLECLDDAQRVELERDLELAAGVQRALLPPEHVRNGHWEVAHRWRPRGAVSGDYCDVLGADRDDVPTHVILGDVSGKGVSASLLMSHLQAIFRSLVSMDLPLDELASRANRIVAEGTLSSSYSTISIARLHDDGAVELVSAGHPPALVVGAGGVRSIRATGLPIGLWRDAHFDIERLRLGRGESILLYSDGLPETENEAGEPFGDGRLEAFAASANGRPVGDVLDRLLRAVDGHRGRAVVADDLTVLTLRRLEAGD